MTDSFPPGWTPDWPVQRLTYEQSIWLLNLAPCTRERITEQMKALCLTIRAEEGLRGLDARGGVARAGLQ